MSLALITDEQFGKELDDTLVANLDFADDICSLGDYLVKAWKLLDFELQRAAKAGLLINVDKTQALNTNDSKNLTYNREKVEIVQNCCHL